MEQKIDVVFKAQQAHKATARATNAAQRIAKLRALKSAIENHESQIFEALQLDLRKSTFEAAVTEVYFIYGELDFAIKNLSQWMQSKRVGKTLSNPFAKNRIYIEPKGVCLIISPWNYPFQLAISPLISSIAAGNCAIVKPSEMSSKTSAVIHQLINEVFEEQEVACMEGDATLATALLRLPFDHIFFTGSTEVGKVVMEAAAKNLASVTLELGGKSPTIIDQSADLESAARKIAWGKLLNSGQTCIAPDYVYVHENQLAKFVLHYQKAAEEMFYNASGLNVDSYGKIINARHFSRLKSLVDEAIELGATMALAGSFLESEHTITPIVLTNVSVKSRLMNEEIFGPVLPVMAYNNLTEVIEYVNSKSKPLALYIFSEDKFNTRFILNNTSAGGTCINNVLIHISNPKLPFGGVNTSGIGASHGEHGFKNFSHERTVVFQRKIDFSRLIYPPYKGREWVLKLLKKIM